MNQNEFSNIFGTITEDRLTFYDKKGWLKGGNRQDVSLKHITSIKHEIERAIFRGILLLIFGVTLFFNSISNAPLGAAMTWKLMGLALAFFGFLSLWGYPLIAINTAGNEIGIMKSWPWNRKMAQDFVNFLRKKTFKE